jgi:hypothetical protein
MLTMRLLMVGAKAVANALAISLIELTANQIKGRPACSR